MRRLPFGFNIFIMWAVMVVLMALPLIVKVRNPSKPSQYLLTPSWRILTWLAPTMLALDADAGNRPWIYYSKTLVWVIMQGISLFILEETEGFTNFEHKSHLVSRKVVLPVIGALFLISCSLTLIGHRLRKHVFTGNFAPVQCGSRVTSIEKKLQEDPYADTKERQIRTPLKLRNLKGAWRHDGNEGTKELTQEQARGHVIRTSILTQYVVSRIFKSPENKFYIYSPVAFYRARVLIVGLAFAGIFHAGKEFFDGETKEAEIIQSLLLWLTLPTITLPALLKIKFGARAQPMLLLRGILPVDSDKDIWSRLNIEPKDLYAALANANRAEGVVKDSCGIVSAGGVGRVHVTDPEKAKQYCKESFIGIGEHYIRISDGKRFLMCKDGQHNSVPAEDSEWWNVGDEEVKESLLSTNVDEPSPYNHHIVQIDDDWKSGWSAFVRSMSSFKS